MMDDSCDCKVIQEHGHRRWQVLASTVSHNIINQFLFLGFASIPDLTKTTFRIDGTEVTWLYTIALIAAIPGIMYTMALMDTYKVAIPLFGVCCTAISSWLRVVAVQRASFSVAVMSSVPLGLGCGKVFVDFAAIPKMWFASSRNEHAMALAIVVQSAFFGFALGGVVVPVVRTQSALVHFSIVQAICASLSLGMHLSCYRTPSLDQRPSEVTELVALNTAAGRITVGIGKSLKLMLFNSSFLMLLVGCGICQGIAFTVPAISAEVFALHGVDSRTSAWANFAFIMSGVIVGLVIGRSGASGKKILIMILFWMLAAALVGLQLVAFNKGMRHPARISIMILLMLVSGGCCFGAVNSAVHRICEVALPVPESHAGGMTEMLSLLLGAFLTQWSVGHEFKVLVGASICSALIMSIGLFLRPR